MKEIFVVQDRRVSLDEVLKAIVEGRITSVYFHESAAKRDAYPTEVVWKITIKAELLSKT
jgi:hypothetical protein